MTSITHDLIAELQEAFNIFDKKRDGVLDEEELT
jgi:Ca2+-binding EF-hand superfamily protein